MRDAAKNEVRKLKTILSSLPLGQSVVLSSTYIVRKNVRVRIYAVRRTGRDGDTLLILVTPVESSFSD